MIILAYCTKCGNQLAEGAKYCSKCGASVSSSGDESQEANRERFSGTVYKCPSCGQALGAFDSICPSCGHELRSSDVSKAMRSFLDQVASASSFEPGPGQTLSMFDGATRVASEIKNFAIPNTKEDIFEFMILAHSTVCSAHGGVMPSACILEAWVAKAEQAHQKGHLVLSGDDLEKIDNMYSEIQIEANRRLGAMKRKELNERLVKDRFAKGVLGAAVGIAVLLACVIIELTGGDSSMLQLLGITIVCLAAWSSCKSDGLPAGIVVAVLAGACCGALSLIMSRISYNESMFVLGAFVCICIAGVGFFRYLAQ